MKVTCLANGKVFEKIFDSYYQGMSFVRKCEHSKKIIVLSYTRF